MKFQDFELVKVKIDEKGLIIDYIMDAGGNRRGATVTWAKEYHKIPNEIVNMWRKGSIWVAAIEGAIPPRVLEDELGGGLADRNLVDKLQRIVRPDHDDSTGENLFRDYKEVARNCDLQELTVSDFNAAVQFTFLWKYLPYKGTVKRKTPKVCIDHDEISKASQKQDKFKYAIFPWVDQLNDWLDAFTQECYKVALADLAAKSRIFTSSASQLSLDDFKRDSNAQTGEGDKMGSFENKVAENLNLRGSR